MRYIKHNVDTRQDEKIVKFFMQFGWEGYGIWWGAMELLAKAEKPISEDVIKELLGVKGRRYKRHWNAIMDLQLLDRGSDGIYNKRIQEYAGEYQFTRQRSSERMAKMRSKDNEPLAENVTRNIHEATAVRDENVQPLIEENKNRIEVKENKKRTRRQTSIAEHTFAMSGFFEFEKFAAQFAGTDYEQCDLRFYFEALKNWAGADKKRKDWIATARTFMLNDIRDNKIKMKNGATRIGTNGDEGLSLQQRYVNAFKESSR